MSPRALLVAAVALLGCLPTAEPYRCDRAGGDRACDSAPGARCVRGYCAEAVPNAVCASGLRYTASAAQPGACAPGDDAGSIDVTDATAADDRPDVADDRADVTDDRADVTDDRADVTDDRATTLDATDAPLPDLVAADAPAADLPTAMDVADAPPARDVPVVTDVSDAARPTDAFAPPDAADVPTFMDAGDARDVTDAPDAVDASVAPDVPATPPVDWLSPLPNERFLTGRIPVRIVRRGTETVRVRTALGNACAGAQTVTQILGTAVAVATGRNYLCLRLEVGEDGGVWTSPWRHIVSMGRSFDPSATPHWGHWPDFDGDGRAELLMATETAVRVFHFAYNGSIVSGASVAGPSAAARAVALNAVGDVDGDSYGDAVIAWSFEGRREVWIHRGGPSGLRGPSRRVVATQPSTDADPTFGERVFSLGDRGRDGRSDFGVGAFEGRWVRTFSVDAAGAVVEGPPYVSGAAIAAFVSDADVDGDELPDTAFTTGGATYLSLSSQTNNVLIPAEPDGGTGFGRSLAFGSDLDNDGRGELAVLAPDIAQAVVYQWGPGGLGVLARVDLRTARPAAVAMPGEVSGDSGDDLFVFTGADQVRLRRGGYTNDIDATINWREPLGVILAGATDADTLGRVWGGGTANYAPNGFVVYGYNGSAVTAFPVFSSLAGPVVAVSP